MEQVSRLLELLTPLIQNEEVRHYLRIRVGDGTIADPAALLYPVIFAPDLDRGPYQHSMPVRPTTVAELQLALFRVDVSPMQAVPFLQMILTTDFAYLGYRGPLTMHEAESVARGVVDILGPEVQWWSNVEYPAWAWEHGDFSEDFAANPITGHTYDCAMIGISQAVAVAFLSYADD